MMIQQHKRFGNDLVFLCVGMLFPFIIRLLFPDIYHHFDVGAFNEWIPYTHPFSDVYQTSCYCNYPIVGMLLSSGVMDLLGGSITAFLLFLSFFESLNVLLFYVLLKKLNVPYSGCLAFIFMVLPSTWSGGALWGQIDHIGLTWIFLLIILIHTIYEKLQQQEPKVTSFIYFAIGLLSYLTLFTKQLMVFPLLPVMAALLLILFSIKGYKNKMIAFLMMAGGVIIPFFAVEAWLSTDAQYTFGHYQRILTTGSDHMDIISGNGVNLWTLFYQQLEHPSTQPFLAGITPKHLGVFLFFVTGVWFTIQYIWKNTVASATFKTGWLCLFIAAFNLGFNVLLTGTHERYLFYFYPFLLIAYVTLNKKYIRFSLTDKWFFFASSVLYGMFVLSILNKWLKVNDQHVNSGFHKVIAVVHILLLVRLIWIYATFPRPEKQESGNNHE